MKKTLVLGASNNQDRYSYKAVMRLMENGYAVVPVGIKDGFINGVKILKEFPENEKIHTVSLYVNAKNQEHYYDLILKLQPERIIFNPGAENPDLSELAKSKGIETVEGCTLVMLASHTF